jgi:hypothetical protein
MDWSDVIWRQNITLWDTWYIDYKKRKLNKDVLILLVEK